MRSGPRRWARRSRPPARCRRARRSAVSKRPSAVAARRRGRPRHRRICRLPRVSTLSGMRGVERGRAGASAASMPGSGVSRLPGDRQIGVARCPRPPPACRPAPAPPRRGSARGPAPAPAGRCSFGKMPNEFSPGTSVGGEDGDEPGVARLDGIEIAEREARAGVRRAHHAHPQRVGGRLVGAEDVGAGDLGPAVDARQPGADGAARRMGRPARSCPWGREGLPRRAPHPARLRRS